MNHVYRIVFNRGLGLWQVVGEHARKQGKRSGRSSPRKHRLAVRPSVSAAVMAFASLGTLPTLALAASVTGSGDVVPALPGGPLTEWNVYDVLHIGKQGAGTLTVKDGAKLFSYTSRIGTESGSQGSVTIAGAGSTWTHAGHLMIGAAGHGTLNVEDGGQVSNDFASIGEQAGSSGIARITGGSTWQTSALWVGQGGRGELIVDGGSKVSSSLPGFIGAEAGSEGIATVSGAGSGWSMTASGNDGRLEIGGGGTGTLNILDGGSVLSNNGLIGMWGGSKGSVKVSGQGSSWTNRDPQDANNPGSLFIGSAGTGTLVIEDGGRVSNDRGFIGYTTQGSGAVTVTGQGSLWDNASHLFVGNQGQARLDIRDGGTVTNLNGILGSGAGGRGDASVSGPGATWTNQGDLYVGEHGTGTLAIDNGGTVTSAMSVIGRGSQGKVTVSGPGSQWRNSSSLVVGNGGNGTLHVRDGGKVFSESGALGVAPGVRGEVVIAGPGSTWTNGPSGYSTNLSIGLAGDGLLRIEDGGQVSNYRGFIGSEEQGSGAVTVTGQGSLWDNASHLFAGVKGKASLDIHDGGTVANLDGILGYEAGSRGDALVSGQGSTWTNRGMLRVGDAGTGTLNVEDGGKVTNMDGVVGNKVTGKGTVRVSGPGSVWESQNYLVVGDRGTGTLTLENEGKVTSQHAGIGSGDDSSGSVHVTTNASWENSGALAVGNLGNGTLTVDQGGRVSSAQATIGGLYGGSATVAGPRSSWTTELLTIGLDTTGTLTLTDSGVVSADTVELGWAPLSSGTLNIGSAAGDAATRAGILNAREITFNGRSRLNFNHTDMDYTLSAALVSGGHQQPHGIYQLSGVTRLTGDNARFTGLTRVSDGTLIVADRIGGAAMVYGGTLQFGDGNSGRLSQLEGVSVQGAGSTLAVKGLATLATGRLQMYDQTVLSLATDAQGPAVQAFMVELGEDVVFNLSGIREASELDKVLIDTEIGIYGDFGKVTVGGFNGTVDYLTVNTRKSDDQKQYLASYGLSWTAGNNLAHGTFTLANKTDSFDLGVALVDQAANPDTGWNGKALTKAGLGTLVLSADNTYSGGTTIADGTLQLGNGGNTGSIVGDVLNHGALAFNRNDSLTFGGAISGTGQVIQMGSGTTLLSGDNSYSGGTTLAGGTLQVARDANLGDAAGGLTFTGGTLKTTDSFDSGRSVLLSRTGQFDVAAASVLGLTGKVSGSGDLLKRGEGTLRLDNAANAYGDTLVQAGTLIGNAASISGNIGNAGTLVFDQASDADFAGNIAGLDDSKGQMVKQGEAT
ncbi:hypothetical protein TRE132_22740 [Pseudomonas chlororaphis subsp. aurantiaca]|nr:hypothetical protein TRE132_22740 [Pseudomonas chlororaphis subsp. aurantiaca]